MAANPVGEGVIGVVGLYTLASALTDLPGRIQMGHMMPVLETATSRLSGATDVGTVSWSLTRPGLVLVCVFTLLPGLLVLLARRRLASWLLPEPMPYVTSLDVRAVLRLGLVFLGCYFVVVGLAAYGTVGSMYFAVGDLAKFRSVSNIARPTILVACGIGLCVLATSLAKRLSGGGRIDEGA